MAGKEAKAKEGVGDRGKLAPPERVFDYEPMNSQSGTACSLDISDEWDRDLMQFSSDAGDGFTWEEVPLKPDVIDPAVLAAAVPNFESGSSSRFSFLRILQASMQVLMHTHVGLRDFILLSMKRAPRTVHSRCRARDLMPCPPPLWQWTGPSKPSPRRRKLRRYLQLRNSLVQQIVCVLNWEALGHCKKPPPCACVGSDISEDQLAMLERIENQVDHFASAGDFNAASLGRSAEKLSRLLHASEELPGPFQEVDLWSVLDHVKSGLDPYTDRSSHVFDNSEQKTFEGRDTGFLTNHKNTPPQKHEFDSTPTESISVGLGKDSGSELKLHVDAVNAKPIIADRIKWEHSPSFDPRPFLTDPVVKRAFEDPNSLRLHESLWTKQPSGKIHCSRNEVLKLAEKWDAVGALRIFQSDEIDHSEAVGAFAVGKDQDHDRLILNPVVMAE